MDTDEYKPIQIWDARFANFYSPFKGRPFSLYNFNAIFLYLVRHRLLKSDILMAKTDWQCFYPSLVLPPALWHYTIQHVMPSHPSCSAPVSTLIRTRRGIFGAAFMPAVGQATNVSLFQDSEIPGCECRNFQIIDDTLIISTTHDPCDAHCHSDRMMALGENKGLLEAKTKREKGDGNANLVFCGKGVSILGISHPAQQWWAAALHLLTAFPTVLSPHQKRSFCGKMNWLICHQPLARPFLSPLYPGSHLNCNHPFILFNIFMALCIAATPRSTDFAFLLNDPPGIFNNKTRPTVYVDSSFTDQLCGIIIQTPTMSKGIRYLIPDKFSQDQQAAELYGLFKAIQMIDRLRLKDAIIIGDNQGSLYDLFTMKSPTRRWWRISILQRISILMLNRGDKMGYISIKWMPGIYMPADVLSRNFVHRIGVLFNLERVPNQLFRHVCELPEPPDINLSSPPRSVWS